MKKIASIAVIIFAVTMASIASNPVAEGKTHTIFGDFKVQVDSKPMTINGIQHFPYLVTYENSDMEVRIAIDLDKNGKKYYVISDDLCVQYVSNRKYFGVERLALEIEIDGYKTSDELLNRNEFFRQRIITSGNNRNVDNTELVAAYFPMLLGNLEMMAKK